MKYLKLIVVLICCFFSCNNSDFVLKSNIEILGHISFEPGIAQQVLMEDLYTDVSYVCLETLESSIIGRHYEIKRFEPYIGVLNTTDAPFSFLLFESSTGKFINSIDINGNQPGSLTYAYDFIIDEEKIYFVSNVRRVISIYNIQCEFIDDVSISFAELGILGIDQNIVTTGKNTPSKFNGENNNVTFFDKKLNKLFSYGKVPKYLEQINFTDIIYASSNGNEVIYHQPISDTIFRINNNNKIKFYIVSHKPKLSIPKNIRDMEIGANPELTATYINNRESTYPIKGIKDLSDFMVIFYNYMDDAYLTVYHKLLKESKTFTIDSEDKRNYGFNPRLANNNICEIFLNFIRSNKNNLTKEFVAKTNLKEILEKDRDENMNPCYIKGTINTNYLNKLFQ